MRLLLSAKVYGWTMTGLLGKGGAWFIGYSRRPDAQLGVTAQQIEKANARLMQRGAHGVGATDADTVSHEPLMPRSDE